MSDKTLPDGDGGVNIRAIGRQAQGNPNVSMIEFQVWPIPTTLVEELANHMQVTTNNFLKDKGIVDGNVTHHPVIPPGSKLQ